MKPRIWLCAASLVSIILLPALAGAVQVTATFADGKGTSSTSVGNVVDAYLGMGGNGWDAGWLQIRTSSSSNWSHAVLGPDDIGTYYQLVDGNYLRYKVTATGTTPHAAIGRKYAGLYGIDTTKDHTLQFTMRIEEDLTAATFLNNTNARYQIHDRVYTPGQTTASSYSSTYSTWGIQLLGDNDTYGDGVWSILGSDLTGLGGTSTGILAKQNIAYTFTVDFHPSAQTFDVAITSDDLMMSPYSQTGFGLAPTATGGTGPTGWLDFWTFQTKTTAPTRQFALDAIHITGSQNPNLPGGMTQVAAHFNGGNSTTVTDGYTGMAGDGWDGAWQTFDWRVAGARTVVSPGDDGYAPLHGASGAYLQMTNTGVNPDAPPDGHGKSGVGRDYRRDYPDAGINWTDTHTIKFTVRIDEDLAGAGTFNTSLDRYQVYDSSTPGSNIDATTVWAVQACGASDGGAITEEMVGEWIFTYGNGSGGTGGYADSNIDIVSGGVYDFTIVVDPTTQTYDAKIQYGSTSYTANDLVWKTASDMVGGSVTFMSIITTKDEVRAWSIDELVITQGAPTAIPGDTNNDGFVNATDAGVLAQNWGRTNADGLETIGDFNGDRAVNAADAAILAANWTGNGEGAATVPEPGTLLLVAAGAIMAIIGRRRVGR